MYLYSGLRTYCNGRECGELEIGEPRCTAARLMRSASSVKLNYVQSTRKQSELISLL